MAEFFYRLGRYLQMAIVQNALIVGVLIALCSSLLGVTLVLKRFSFIGDGLSHVAFWAMAIAAVAGLTNNILIVMPITVICAVLLLKSSRNAKIKGDASLAMISVATLAIGYLLWSVFPTSSNVSADVCKVLFGSEKILTLDQTDVIVCIVLSIVVVLTFIIFYNKIFAITFDENFALATGTKANVYNIVLAIIIALVIVLAMNLVGSLLISALIIFPALSAMRTFKTFKSVTICSCIVSVSCALLGIFASIILGTPTGPTIVVADIVVFFAFYLIGIFSKGRKVA
ncbi:MAG: metal ABC transporter permease [Clostridia bacterium]|nr:metal ABC transporter permease [Clostridia bacterium]